MVHRDAGGMGRVCVCVGGGGGRQEAAVKYFSTSEHFLQKNASDSFFRLLSYFCFVLVREIISKVSATEPSEWPKNPYLAKPW